MLKRILSIALMLCILIPSAFAADPTPTPPPVEISAQPAVPPQMIRNVLDLAYAQWEELAGATLKEVNKYTEWRGKGVGFGWCGGFITWCMLECGVPMEELEFFKDKAKESENRMYPAEGIMHVKEASVGKLLRGYQIMNRSTNIPQPGYLLVYGCSYNMTIHVGLVYDVVELGNGRYRITTIEGNMSDRVKMYVHDYDSLAENPEENLSEIPEADRTQAESDYFNYVIPTAKVGGKKHNFYVNCFLMPWIPGDEAAELTTPTPSPAE